MNYVMYKQIKEEYDNFYSSLLSRGKLPLRPTSKGFWGHIPAEDIYGVFRRIGLQSFKTFIDLGSGDGKVVLIASLFCKRAAGIEVDNELFQKSLEMQKKLRVPNAAFFNSDYYGHSVAGFDAVFVYPDEPLHRGIEKKLLNEMTGKLLHCGHHFHPSSLTKEKATMVNGTLLTVYSR